MQGYPGTGLSLEGAKEETATRKRGMGGLLSGHGSPGPPQHGGRRLGAGSRVRDGASAPGPVGCSSPGLAPAMCHRARAACAEQAAVWRGWRSLALIINSPYQTDRFKGSQQGPLSPVRAEPPWP